jgi:hypothetical protein
VRSRLPKVCYLALKTLQFIKFKPSLFFGTNRLKSASSACVDSWKMRASMEAANKMNG